MPETVMLVVNGVSVEMPAGSMVSAAILKLGTTHFDDRQQANLVVHCVAWGSVSNVV